MRFRNASQELPRLVREAVARIDRNVPVSNIKVFDAYVDESLMQPRFYSLLLGGFAGVALLLTAIGIYGLLAFQVSERTREIGLRLAVGAQKGDIFKLIQIQGMRLVLPGIILGLAASLMLTRLVRHMLYGIGVSDPLTFILISVLLIVVASLACIVPAYRAARVDPLRTLRQE